MSHQIICVAATRSQLGEGAVWDDRAQVLWWVDIPAGLIHAYDPVSGENATHAFGEPVGCLAVRDAGGLVVAAKSGFWFFDPATGARQPIHDPEAHLPNSRFNDGATDYQGRFWAGTMSEAKPQPAQGALYRLDPDLSVTQWRDGIYTPNGLAFAPDGRHMYFSDSYPEIRTIWRAPYDPDTGSPGAVQPFFDTRPVPGRPDGACVDAEGCYWQAGVGGWQLYRLSPEGARLLTIDLPVEKPSKSAFGGADLDVLYVTSIGSGLTDGTDQPLAGSLFAITGLGITGLPQTRFAG